MKKIVVACDHGGIQLKNTIKSHLQDMGYEVTDFGINENESIDYPISGYRVAKAITSGEFERGLLFCGTGLGISLSANKVKGIRCAVCSDIFTAKYSRLHNNTNILALGERVVAGGLAIEIVNAWLETNFEGGRHERRVNLITDIENGIDIDK